MKCPHCLEGIHENWAAVMNYTDLEAHHGVQWMVCPECKRYLLRLTRQPVTGSLVNVSFLYPRSTARPVPTDVPEPFRGDYLEASAVLGDSPKASAALSRRNLQHILREEAKVKHADLSAEIDEILKRGTLPSHLADAIDAIRQIGNFAAHPIKSQTSGAVVEVEPGEAEWLLDVLDSAFDFWFVQPAILKLKRDALNQKLSNVGKPPLKASPP